MTELNDPSSDSFAPFCAEEIDYASLPQAGTPKYNEFVAHYIAAAFAFVRATPGWKKTKLASSPEGGSVQCRSLNSGMKGKLGKCAWHLRESRHLESQTGLEYDDFRKYLRFDHPTFEAKYIPDIILSERVAALKEQDAEIWHNAYKLPVVTADRDFVQLLLTLDLPPHSEPFSEAHEQVALAAARDSSVSTPDAKGQKSFLVIQFPVAHPDYPETSPRVRGTYASFEAVWEEPVNDTSDKYVNWKMAVQSDTRGKIPVLMQEMSMPGEIAHDVPAFIKWAQKYKKEVAK